MVSFFKRLDAKQRVEVSHVIEHVYYIQMAYHRLDEERINSWFSIMLWP